MVLKAGSVEGPDSINFGEWKDEAVGVPTSLGSLLDAKMLEVQDLLVAVDPDKLQSIKENFPDTAQEKINELPEIKYNRRIAMQKIAEAIIEHLEQYLEINVVGIQSTIEENEFVTEVTGSWWDIDVEKNTEVTIDQKTGNVGTGTVKTS